MSYVLNSEWGAMRGVADVTSSPVGRS